jgi:N-carbamoylputrescine amidase
MNMDDICIAAVVFNSRVGEVARNLETSIQWIKRAHAKGAQLVCFPEMHLTGYVTDERLAKIAQNPHSPAVQTLSELAVRLGITILAGMAEKGDDGQVYASHFALGSDGSASAYRKVHIAPPEKRVLTAGNRVAVFKAAGVTLGIQLCYDAHFPELSAQMALRGADVIFIPHASPRGTPQAKFHSWNRHLPARAFDNGLFIVACNHCGAGGGGLDFPGLAVTYGPDGRLIESDLTGREGVLITTLLASDLEHVRHHPMRYFLPQRMPQLYDL